MDNLSVLTAIFRDELSNAKLTIAPATTPDDLESWDSLAHVRIIARVEEEFGFEFSLDEIEDSMSVSKLLDIIAARQN